MLKLPDFWLGGKSLKEARNSRRIVALARAQRHGETGASSGATLLGISVSKERTLFCDAINIRRLVAHHAVIIGAYVSPADVVSPDDEDIGFLLLCRSGRSNEDQRTGERGRYRNTFCFHSLVMF